MGVGRPSSCLFMKKLCMLSVVVTAFSSSVSAQQPIDTLPSQRLSEVVVSAQLQRTSPVVSTFIPTKRQKNSAQTGTELLDHMAIPQLGLVSGFTVTTNSGQAVDLFIDYVPASEQDLSGMRMSDVKKVEYYDFPQDPRFQGKAHVINFVMQKYDYGGYVKAYANEFFISNTGQLNLFSKVQYRKMTYDLAVGGWYSHNNHMGTQTVEIYRIPQPEGPAKVFERLSIPELSRVRQHSFWPTFKATYTSGKTTMVNTVGSSFFFSPKQNTSGSLTFTPEVFTGTDYADTRSARTNSVTYSGYWNFILPHGNSINFTPYYSYSHTNQRSTYTEGAQNSFVNDALDDSHCATGALRYVHDFGRWGSVTALCNAYIQVNHTRYSGTSSVIDRMKTWRVGPGVLYNYKNDKFNGLVGVGLNYERSKFGSVIEKNTQPWIDASLQYSFSSRHSAAMEFHHASWSPASVYRSTAVIQSNPLLSYTGNPALEPYRTYDIGARYVWMPDNRWNISLFGYGYVVNDRFAYVYQPSATGILRSISQNVGVYSQWLWGVNGSVRLFGNSLAIKGNISHRIVRNGAPYSWTKQGVVWYLQAFYYYKGWNFGLQYQSPQVNCDGHVTGMWVKEKSSYAAIAGWGDSSWNIQARLTNPFRWNWLGATSIMQSQYYDIETTTFNTGNHCFIMLSATYTFGFGKKIQRGNEAGQQMGTSSGILK